MKKTKQTKWAQLTPLERAYQKARNAEKYHCGLDFSGPFGVKSRMLPHERDEIQKREYNKYYQLLAHWCALKKSKDLQSSNK